MHDYGIWSLVPPLLTVVMAIVTRQVVLSLLVGVVLGYLVLNGFAPGTSASAAAQGLVDVFKADDSAKVLIFITMVGGIIHLARVTRGTQGLIRLLSERSGLIRGPKSTQFLAMILTALIFVESNISELTAGIVTQPLASKYRVAREKLAYIIRNTGLCIWSSVLINGWGAAMMAVIATQVHKDFISGSPFWILARAIGFNLFAWSILLLTLLSVFTRFSFPGMRRASQRAAQGIEMRAGSQPLVDDEEPTYKDCPPAALNLILPLLAMIATVPVGLYITGDGHFSEGSGSTAVLWGVMVGQVVGGLLYVGIKRILSVNEFFDELLQGYKTMLPLAVIMVLAFLIGDVAGELDVGGYLSSHTQGIISPNFVAPIIFIMAGIISLSTGTSWGTFSIMIPIGIQMAAATQSDPYIVIGAAISGSLFGDGVSPISDTGIVAAMGTRSNLMDHIHTQLPYEIAASLMALAGFIALGLYF